ncbi:TolC family protein [bacterium]|nr:TolC family protein [bacterium]
MMRFNKIKILIGFIVVCFVALSSNIAYAIVEVDKKDNVKQERHIIKLRKDKKKNTKADTAVQREYTNNVHSVFSLADCVNIAIKYNPTIRAYLCDEDVYKSKIGQAWANFFPSISAGIDIARSGQTYSKDVVIGGRSQYMTMGYLPNISGEMMLFDFGKTKATADMFKRMYEARQADTKETINTVIYDIKTTYYNVLFAQAQVHVYEDTVKDYELQLAQAWGFYNIGKKAKIDVVTAEYNLGKAQLNLVKAKSVLEIALVQLSKIMGIPEYTNYELSDQLLLNDYKEDVENAINTAFDVRPELIAAKKGVDAAKMNLRAKRRDFTPDIGIFAGYGNQIGNKYNMYSSQFGAALSYSNLNLMRVKKEIDEAKASLKKSEAEYEDVKHAVYYNVKKNYIDLQTAKQEILIAKLALDQAKEQYRQVTGRYKAGVGDAIELKDGENTYLNARLDFYNAMLNYNVAAASLEREIGVPIKFSENLILDISKER